MKRKEAIVIALSREFCRRNLAMVNGGLGCMECKIQDECSRLYNKAIKVGGQALKNNETWKMMQED